MSNKVDVSIIIPTFNREDELLDSINDCLKQDGVDYEVLVIDQSTRHSQKFREALKILLKNHQLRYFKVTPPSVTAAKNFGLIHATSEIVIFIDDDVKIPKDFAKQHLLAHINHPDVSAVGGRVLQKGFPIMNEVLHFDKYAISRGVFTSPKAGYTNAFAGGNVSIKTKDALYVGGFDTRYYLNAFREESDMSIKMSRSGQKIYYEPEAVLTHLASPRGGSRSRTYGDIRDTRMFYHNELFFTLRAVKFINRLSAIQKKYNEYCNVPSRKTKLKRTLLFTSGIIAALWRIVFGRQIKAKELA